MRASGPTFCLVLRTQTLKGPRGDHVHLTAKTDPKIKIGTLVPKISHAQPKDELRAKF